MKKKKVKRYCEMTKPFLTREEFGRLAKDLLSGIPNVLEDEAAKSLEMFYGFYKLGLIEYDQFIALAFGLTDQLNWFSNDIPERKIKECCEETYADVVLKNYMDKKITFRQFAFMRRRNLRLFGKGKNEKNSKNNSLL